MLTRNAAGVWKVARRNAGGKAPIQEPGGVLFQGTAREPDAWSSAYWLTCVVAAVFGTVGLAGRPDTSISSWARNEALARRAADAADDAKAGDSFLQSSTTFSKEAVGARPTTE